MAASKSVVLGKSGVASAGDGVGGGDHGSMSCVVQRGGAGRECGAGVCMGGVAAAGPAAPRRWRHGVAASLGGSATASAAAAAAARPAALLLRPRVLPTTARRRFCLLSLIAAALSSTLLIATTASADDGGGGWRYGRATFYGSLGGGSIDTGSCMYGSLPNGMVSTGTDIAALSDTADDYGGSCGRCYEVQCNPTSFSDGYGNHIDRTSPCYGNSSSVIVTVTDTCPCYYPANEYSNRRWCCGDMYHMDLSSQAFSKLADLGWGVIGMRFRVVSCPGGFQPSPRAATSDFPAGTKK
ncbi:hypothetical protein HYH02_002680 [Chlamydomonas schloesseri]|uniref:Expansin-like EG45 domain-containing protein n=1 Tax=Chlamydomonas schloesseri TaxID=2026947 RepID=A0A836BA84_9CHLO|nr:hypothetical protein HYH02_002680 [Chlamydomonas schloesseri]|eukprot:KAG2452437.1 hypothetical protein HYH02_002680 [Chlamydomonas schloesseri]